MKIYLYELPDKLNNLTQYKLPVHLLKPFDNLIYGSEVTGVNSCQFEVFSLPSLLHPHYRLLTWGTFRRCWQALDKLTHTLSVLMVKVFHLTFGWIDFFRS